MAILAVSADLWTPTARRLDQLGPDLLTARARLQLTTSQQAAAVGVGVATLTGLVEGTTNPTKTTITAALRWLAANR